MSPSLLLADKTAQKAHYGQLRDGGDPYITHPQRVQTMLQEYGLPEYVQIAGVLHDVLEDTDFSDESVKKIFGLRVYRLVKAMTKQAGVDYCQQLRLCTEKDPYVLFVKMADRLDNLQTMDVWPEDKISRYILNTEELLAKFIIPSIYQLEDEALMYKALMLAKQLIKQIKFYQK